MMTVYPCNGCGQYDSCAESGYTCALYNKYINIPAAFDKCPVSKVRCNDYDSLTGYCCAFSRDIVEIEDGNCPIPRTRRGRPPKKELSG